MKKLIVLAIGVAVLGMVARYYKINSLKDIRNLMPDFKDMVPNLKEMFSN